MLVGKNHFSFWDYTAVGATLGFSIAIGIYFACVSKQTREDVLLGGRQMGAFPVAASMLVTYLSAITILGYPAEIYEHGIQIFIMVLVSFFGVPISFYLFIKVFYKMEITSIYEYLEKRFDSLMVRWMASFVFIFQVLLISGVVLYAPSIALKAILGIPTWASIVLIGLCGTVYTSIGGLKAVLWTDVFQLFMILIGMCSILVKGFISAGGISSTFIKANEGGRLQLFDLTVDPFMRHNTLNFVLGYGVSTVTLYGTHQPQVQRYRSLPSFRHVLRAIILAILLKTLTVSLVLVTGIAIYATYAGCDPMILGHIEQADAIVPHFVIEQLSTVPAMMGIFVSCVFSAVLSTISSALNSLAAVTWEDFLSRINYFSNMNERRQAITTRLISVTYGVLFILLAFLAQNLGALFQMTMTAVGATSGPLGGIFVLGLFMPFVNKHGAFTGMLVGLVSMLYFGANSHLLSKQYKFHLPLPNHVADCPEGINRTNISNSTLMALNIDEIDWPDKIFTVSYILYSFLGIAITISVAIVVSLLTKPFCATKPVSREYLHPLLHRFVPEENKKGNFQMEKLRSIIADSQQNQGIHKNYLYRSLPTYERTQN